MSEQKVSTAKMRLLDRLKRGGQATAGELAVALDLTDVAIRQHLLALERQGLVRQRTCAPTGRGRPAVVWSLAELAQAQFPERHAELTIGLIEAARQAVGEDGLQRIINVRARVQAAAYRKLMPAKSASLRRRIEALAKQRTAEGYMAEVKREAKGVYLLIEHHCPICDAARSCVGLCGAELEVFQKTLGPSVTIQRVQHILTGDHRCAYRVTTAD